MRAPFIFAGLITLVAGCGSSPVTITVGTQTLTIKDEGYFTTSGVDYCAAAAPGEMLLDFVDFNFLCDPKNPPERDKAVPHTELQIVLSMNNPLRDPRKPYVVGVADCQNGPTAEAIGRFLHYPPNSTQPDMTMQATSGNVTITQFPSDKTKPWVGTYDLVFNNTHVKEAFTIYACN